MKISMLLKILVCVFIFSSVIIAEEADLIQQTPAPAEENPGFDDEDVSGKGELGKYYGFDEMEIVKLNDDIFNMIITDINGDDINDIAVINNSRSRLDLLIAVKEPVDITERKFFSDENDDINEFSENGRFRKDSVLINVKALNLVSGDFNGDGLNDFAFYGNPKGLYLLLQKPSSDESTSDLNWQSLLKIKIDDGLGFSSAIVADDINSDGRDDLILLSADSVYILYQQQDGSLTNPVKFGLTDKPLGVEVCDINNDGYKDIFLITVDESLPIHIRFGGSDGKFGALSRYYIDRPAALAMGKKADKNRFYSIDLQSARLSGYEYKPEADLKINEIPIIYYPLESASTSTYSDITAGDFNGDNLCDIAVSNPTSAQITFFANTSNGLDKGIDYPALSETTKITAVKLDKSNKSHIVSLSIKDKNIAISSYENGRFTFPEPINMDGEPLAFDTYAANGGKYYNCALIAKDANDARFFEIIYKLSKDDKNKKSEKLYLKDVLSNPEDLKAMDFDSDGLMDFVVFVSRYADSLFIRQVSEGKFEIMDSQTNGLGIINTIRPESFYIGNIGGQEQKDILIASGNFARNVRFDNKEMRWDIIDQYNGARTNNSVNCAVSFDIDDDKSSEIILFDSSGQVMQVLKKDADNIFRFSNEQEIGSWQLKKVFTAPLAENNKQCIVLFDGKKFAVINPSISQGSFEKIFSYETDVKNGKYARLATGELNQLGITDLAVLEYTKAYMEILAMQNPNSLQLAMRFRVFEQKSFEAQQPQTIEPRQIEIADVNGDGKDDMIIIVHDRIIVYPQD